MYTWCAHVHRVACPTHVMKLTLLYMLKARTTESVYINSCIAFGPKTVPHDDSLHQHSAQIHVQYLLKGATRHANKSGYTVYPCCSRTRGMQLTPQCAPIHPTCAKTSAQDPSNTRPYTPQGMPKTCVYDIFIKKTKPQACFSQKNARRSGNMRHTRYNAHIVVISRVYKHVRR
jgi:hypothetical protein